MTYDILADGKLLWSCLSKPLAFAFISGMKEGKGDNTDEDKNTNVDDTDNEEKPDKTDKFSNKSGTVSKPVNKPRRML